MSPEDSIRMLVAEKARFEAMLAQHRDMETHHRLSDAEREEAQAKYLRRLQEPFVYRGRPEPIMSEEEIAELDRIQDDIRRPIAYKMPYGALQGGNPLLPYDLRGL